jgi:hypothetical protein
MQKIPLQLGPWLVLFLHYIRYNPTLDLPSSRLRHVVRKVNLVQN